jgi:hypothetical protein
MNRRTAGVARILLPALSLSLSSEDVHIEGDRGTEYAGAVSPEQMPVFGAAFSDATPLLRATVAQFSRNRACRMSSRRFVLSERGANANTACFGRGPESAHRCILAKMQRLSSSTLAIR